MFFEYQGYLTEKKLATLVQQLFRDGWIGEQTTLPGTRYRWDMSYRTPEGVTVIEFDGPSHYRDSNVIRRDLEKDERARAAGLHVIRIPYWVQLDAPMVHYYFNTAAEVRCAFPHGFITTKVYPASFCEAGVSRFVSKLDLLPTDVGEQVVQSLRGRIAEHGMRTVVPSILFERITNTGGNNVTNSCT